MTKEVRILSSDWFHKYNQEQKIESKINRDPGTTCNESIVIVLESWILPDRRFIYRSCKFQYQHLKFAFYLGFAIYKRLLLQAYELSKSLCILYMSCIGRANLVGWCSAVTSHPGKLLLDPHPLTNTVSY